MAASKSTVVIWFRGVGCRIIPPRFAPGKLYAPIETPLTNVVRAKMVSVFSTNDTRPTVMKFSGISIRENTGLMMMPTKKKAAMIISMFLVSLPRRIVGISEYAK